MVDPMPRAEKLNDAYNNLYVEPLKEGTGVQGVLRRKTS
jgi:hypothetical protein